MRTRSPSRTVAALALLALVAAPLAAAAAPAWIDQLPPGERWVQHLREDLLPFWNLPDAWSTPRGSFPTYRCNDGRRYDPARPCDELRYAPGWMSATSSRQYVRMMSRQAYFYGAAFHLTGDPAMLALARDGVDYLRGHALERDTGSAVTWLED